MAGTEDEDGYSDDDLDALASEDFLELQNRAIQSTQHVRRSVSNRQWRPDPSEQERLLSYPVHSYVSQTNLDVQQPSNPVDYGEFEDLLDEGQYQLQKAPLTSKRTNTLGATRLEHVVGLQQRLADLVGRPSQIAAQHQYPPHSSITAALPHRGSPTKGLDRHDTRQFSSDAQKVHGPAGNAEEETVKKFQAELEELRSENQELQKAVKTANDHVLAKTGEISIIRSNQAKVARDHERRLEELQREHVKENERYRGEVEQAKKEKERLATHNQFLDHENDQKWQLRQAQKQTKNKNSSRQDARGNNVSTPRKARDLDLRDGFNDDELMVVSPSKLGGQRKAVTPKLGAKRKRDAVGDSPAQPLQLSQGLENLSLGALDSPSTSAASKKAFHIDTKDRDRFDFLQRLLNHRILRNEKRSLEVLAGFTLPDDTSTTLTSLLLDKMAPLSTNQGIEDFPGAIGSIVISVWSDCLEKKYYQPLKYLMDLVKFVLLNGSSMTAQFVMDELVTIAQQTADVNIIPRYLRFRPKTASKDGGERQSSNDIDTHECLQLLDLTSTLCARKPEQIARFWRSMRFDFISMVLRNSQDIQDIILLVKVLLTSVQPASFAMIVAPPASQLVSEQHVIDRLSSMLIEVPRTMEGAKEYSAVQVSEVRLQILTLIERMCGKRYCGEAFARHPLALGRLVRLMNDELNALYDYRHGHEYRAELVNRSTSLLFHITSVYSETVGNLQEKLRAPPTSVFKHLITLSRLAFSEGVFFERGIHEDVMDCAHQMLEELVTPEEGEALQKAFVRDEK